MSNRCFDGRRSVSDGAFQAANLRAAAKAGGLRFEAYLPPSLADWMLGLIEAGMVSDPSEAVFVILGEHHELEPHLDLRDELLRRMLQAAMDDPGPMIPHEEVQSGLQLRSTKPRARPAVWEQKRR